MSEDGRFMNNGRGGPRSDGFRDDRRGGPRSFSRPSLRDAGGFEGRGGATRPRAPFKEAPREDAYDISEQKYYGHFKWFNFESGYGFITPADKGSSDMFAHIRNLDPDLVAVMQQSGADLLTECPVVYQVATNKVVSGSQKSARPNFDKPFAVRVKRAGDDDEDAGAMSAGSVEDEVEQSGDDSLDHDHDE